ncbi:MAG: DoxX family membrane protein [Gammaproteobacteria bacterium]|nr:DoxX family membrane protein [Gammaproteobacteria bacterium]
MRAGRTTGIACVLFLRWLFALFHLLAAVNKLRLGWLWSDQLRQLFIERLGELEPGSFAVVFLQSFGIPLYLPIAWVVTVAEFVVAASLFLGLCTRAGALLALWLILMFGIGGYYDASLIALGAWGALFVLLPTGHWQGMDRRLHARHPRSLWFR